MNNAETQSINQISYVTKRNGQKEPVDTDKIYNRIHSAISYIPALDINARLLTLEVKRVLEPDIKTRVLDEETCKICANKIMIHPHYKILASRIIIRNLHKNTGRDKASFSSTMKKLYYRVNTRGKSWPAINTNFYQFIDINKGKLDNIIHYDRDYGFDYFGFKTLERSCLLKDMYDQVLERPQDMYLRVAAWIHMSTNNTKADAITISNIKETYRLLSLGMYSHASPTYYNSGTHLEQVASCFIYGVGDSGEEIMKAWSDAAAISSAAGGIGVHCSNIRATGASIRNSGTSAGPLPFLKIANDTMKAFNQGGKRPGSMAIFMEPWHADIVGILNARRPHIEENLRAKDLFYALWIPDLFMKQLYEDKDWWLMCPVECPGLSDVYGKTFEKKYMSYVKENKYIEKIKARELWTIIMNILIETGIPYIGFKDHVNNKSNQKNIGTIKSSNLCMEIMEYSDTKEYAVCVLSSLVVHNFLIPAELEGAKTWEEYKEIINNKTDNTSLLYNTINLLTYDSNLNKLYSRESFDVALKSNKMINYQQIFRTIITIIRNLNIIIDKNAYPNKETLLSNKLHRPLGLGVQGLADLYFKLKIPFDSKEAVQINKELFEGMLFCALWASSWLSKNKHEYNIANNVLCKTDKYYMKVNKNEDDILPGYYPTFKYNGGSPSSKGIFQYHMWGKTEKDLSNRWDWENMRKRVIKYGLRNSQLLALMPTANTSQILGNNECFEPQTAAFITRKTIAGEFIVGNKYLINDLHNLGLLTSEVINNIIEHDGSVRYLHEVVQESQLEKFNVNIDLYKTAWEINMKSLIDQAADRGIFICQSQSMNLWIEHPTLGKLTTMYYYAWSKGLKTGGYYLRSRTRAKASQYYKNKNNENRLTTCNDHMCCT